MSQLMSCYELAPIISADGANYGLEITAAARDSLDERVDQKLSALTQPLNILDIGGATGFRAQQFAQHGHKVTVVDICDHAASVALRNRFNELQQPPIKFHRANAASLADESFLNNTQWQFIHARRVIHWMPYIDVERFLSSLPRMVAPNSCLALCFQTAKETSGTLAVVKTTNNHFYHHSPQDIVRLMQKAGYDIEAHGREPQPPNRSYKIIATARPCA